MKYWYLQWRPFLFSVSLNLSVGYLFIEHFCSIVSANNFVKVGDIRKKLKRQLSIFEPSLIFFDHSSTSTGTKFATKRIKQKEVKHGVVKPYKKKKDWICHSEDWKKMLINEQLLYLCQYSLNNKNETTLRFIAGGLDSHQNDFNKAFLSASTTGSRYFASRAELCFP